MAVYFGKDRFTRRPRRTYSKISD